MNFTCQLCLYVYYPFYSPYQINKAFFIPSSKKTYRNYRKQLRRPTKTFSAFISKPQDLTGFACIYRIVPTNTFTFYYVHFNLQHIYCIPICTIKTSFIPLIIYVCFISNANTCHRWNYNVIITFLYVRNCCIRYS